MDKYGKDLCFESVLHEILHLQTKNMFNEKFQERLNQLLTVWLIENYSPKYKIQRNAYILIPTLKGNIKLISSSKAIIKR